MDFLSWILAQKLTLSISTTKSIYDLILSFTARTQSPRCLSHLAKFSSPRTLSTNPLYGSWLLPWVVDSFYRTCPQLEMFSNFGALLILETMISTVSYHPSYIFVIQQVRLRNIPFHLPPIQDHYLQIVDGFMICIVHS